MSFVYVELLEEFHFLNVRPYRPAGHPYHLVEKAGSRLAQAPAPVPCSAGVYLARGDKIEDELPLVLRPERLIDFLERSIVFILRFHNFAIWCCRVVCSKRISECKYI